MKASRKKTIEDFLRVFSRNLKLPITFETVSPLYQLFTSRMARLTKYWFYRSLFLRKNSCSRPYKTPFTFQNSAVPITN